VPPRSRILLFFCCISLCGSLQAASPAADQLRPPAVPLVTCDPYFSIWSTTDRLTDAPTVHWTGTRQALAGLIRIDSKAYRIIGPEPASVPALPQVGLQVLPTRTIYDFEGQGVHVTLTLPLRSWPQTSRFLRAQSPISHGRFTPLTANRTPSQFTTIPPPNW
jgi:hypothetical protein